MSKVEKNIIEKPNGTFVVSGVWKGKQRSLSFITIDGAREARDLLNAKFGEPRKVGRAGRDDKTRIKELEEKINNW